MGIRKIKLWTSWTLRTALPPNQRSIFSLGTAEVSSRGSWELFGTHQR